MARADGPERHAAQLLPTSRDFLGAVWAAIDRASRRLFVECYIVRGDGLGRQLVARLARAAARGVDTRLLYDPSGSSDTPAAFFAAARRAGVAVRPYGRAAFLGAWRAGFRDHARLLLADDAAFTGGHAWGDEWSPREWGGRGWRDLNCHVSGPVVEEWASLYRRRWEEAAHGWPISLDTGRRYPDLRLVSDGPGGRRWGGRGDQDGRRK